MRLLTYNIHKGIGGADRRYRLERILQVIAAEEPDIVCLQEVDRNLSPQQLPRSTDDAGGATRCRRPCLPAECSHSRGRLRQPRAVALAFAPGESRFSAARLWQAARAQMVVVDTPQGALHLVNWHLGLGEKERRWQTNLLLGHTLFRESSHLPTLIAGDSNDWRNCLHGHAFEQHGFTQVTNPIKHYRSFPAFWPLASLDKVYRRGPVCVSEAHIVRHRLARRASDHLPLVVDFCAGNGIGRDGLSLSRLGTLLSIAHVSRAAYSQVHTLTTGL